MFISSCST